jgi:hypothetical protein
VEFALATVKSALNGRNLTFLLPLITGLGAGVGDVVFVSHEKVAGCTGGFRLEGLGAPADRASRPGSVRLIRFAALLSKSRPSFPR